MFSSFISQLSQRSEPAVRWSGEAGELELTGSVFANWIYKSTALWEAGGAEALVVISDGHAHWRAAAAALAAAGLGLDVHVLSPDDPAPAEAHIALAPAGLEDAEAAFDADDVYVYALEPLALTTEVDDGFLDFLAEVRSQPDVVPLSGAEQLTFDFSGRTLTVPVPADAGPDAVLTAAPADEAELADGLRALLGGILQLR